MKSYYLYLLLPFIFMGFSCSSSKKAQSESISEEIKLPEQTIAKDTFLLPKMPKNMTNPKERAKFLTMHYWDRFDFNNEKMIKRPQITEQALVDYINILKYVSKDNMIESIKNTLRKAEINKAMFAYIASLFDKYLYEPNSPFRNEDLYLSVLNILTKSAKLSKGDEAKYKFQLEMAQKNNIGSKANNFKYTLASGETKEMYSINSNYLIILFSNPGCPTCAATIKQILASEPIANAIKRNTPDQTVLTILTIYPDNNVSEWSSHVLDMPTQWINAYDKGAVITKKRLYDIKAIPTIYLLNNDKKVILKDTSVEALDRFFSPQQ